MACNWNVRIPIPKAILRKISHLCENVTNFQDLQLGTPAQVFRLVDAVSDNDLVESTGVDAVNGITAQNPMCNQRNNLGCTFPFHKFGSACDRVRRVCEVINENGCSIPYVAYQHHRGILTVCNPCRATFLYSVRLARLGIQRRFVYFVN